MRERLIALLCKVECKGDDLREGGCGYRQGEKCNSIEKLDMCMLGCIADHLLANGVIVPPCKVGDTVYRIVKMGTGIHYKQIGRCGTGHTQRYKIVPCEEKIKRFIRSVTVTKNNLFDICENFGKTVFLTREEAEKALKGGAE